MTPEEFYALLPMVLPYQAAWMAWIVGTSARTKECKLARRGDVAKDLSEVRLRGTKTQDSDRIVPLVADWQRMLVQYALQQGDASPLLRPWANARRDIAAACKKLGLEPRSPLDFRHTFSHWLLVHEGLSKETVAAMMGHGSTRMLDLTYGKLRADEVRLRAQLEQRTRYVPQAWQTTAKTAPMADAEQGVNQGLTVPRGGIEPPTRGFSVLTSSPPLPKSYEQLHVSVIARVPNAYQRRV